MCSVQHPSNLQLVSEPLMAGPMCTTAPALSSTSSQTLSSTGIGRRYVRGALRFYSPLLLNSRERQIPGIFVVPVIPPAPPVVSLASCSPCKGWRLVKPWIRVRCVNRSGWLAVHEGEQRWLPMGEGCGKKICPPRRRREGAVPRSESTQARRAPPQGRTPLADGALSDFILLCVAGVYLG